MTTRTDLTVAWNLSPRIITVAAPSVELNMQDLVDTLRVLEDDLDEGLQFDHLIDTAGKEDLGGGVQVGITVTMNNARIAFEKRLAKLESGTVTTPDATGFVLTDSTALFVTNGVVPGDVIRNHTDAGSVAAVLSVDSETQLTTDGLIGGTDNQFDSADMYDVLDWVQCNLSGGNLVALDDVGAPLDPVFPTFGTQVVRTSSSSATIADLGITNLQFLIETLRSEHRAFGDIWYWDPVNGSDGNAGDAPTRAFLTFAAAQAAASDHTGDVIFIVQNTAASLTITERITISKNDLILRGPGPTVLFQPADDTGPTITISGENVSISGLKVASTGVTPQPAIDGTGDSASIKNVWIAACTEDGIHLAGGEDHIIEDCTVETCAGDGIHLVNTINAKVFGNRIQTNTGYGISLEETTTARDCWIARNVFHHNGPGSINIGPGVHMTIITKDNYFGPPPGTPFGDDIVDAGDFTHNEYDEFVEHIWAANMTETYPVDGQSAATPTQMLYSINQMLSEFARTGTTVSIKKRDGTEAFQLTLDSATAPTSSTQAT